VKKIIFLCLIGLFLFFACNSSFFCKEKTQFDSFYEKGMQNYYTFRDSIDFYLNALQENMPEIKSTTKQKAKLLHYKGINFAAHEMADSAIFFYQEANKLLDKPTRLKAVILANLSAVSFNSGNDSVFYRAFNDLESLNHKLKDPFVTGRFFCMKAIALTQKGDIEKSTSYLRKTDSIYNSVDANIWRPYVLCCLGRNSALQSKCDLAFKYYVQAATLAKEKHTTVFLKISYLNLSRLCRKLKKYEKAIYYIDEYKKIIRKKRELARVYESYAIIYAEQKKWKEAEKYMLKSLEVREQIGTLSRIAVSKNNLGTLYLREKNYAKAEKYYKEALQLRYDNNMKGAGLLKNLNNLGDLYVKQKKYAKAIELYKNTIAFTDSYPNLRLSAHAHLKLAESYKALHRWEKSIEQYMTYTREHKELEEEEAKKHLADLLAEHDAIKQKKIIALQKKEVNQKKHILYLLIIVIGLLIVCAVLRIRWYSDKNKTLKRNLEQQKRLNIQQQEIKELKKRLETYSEKEGDSQLLNNLLDLFDNKKVYTNPSLSLEKMAGMLHTNTSYVSNAINSEFQCNFKSLVNKYRIDYCKQAIKKDIQKQHPLKEIAFNAGFVSLSTFYTAFKKELGITPAQFRDMIHFKK